MAYNKFCCWRNMCKTYICCHFCNNKTCEWRCKDSLQECKYSTDTSSREEDYQQVLDKPFDIDIKLLKISEVANILNVKYDDIYLLVTKKEIEVVKVGSRFFIEESTLDIVKEKLNTKITK